MSKFCKNDIVMIANWGEIYSAYTTMADTMGLSRWSRGGPKDVKSLTFKVVALHKHFERDIMLYGVECMKTGKQFIYGELGLKMVSKGNILDEELFVL